jgi:acyl-CoA thioester hydrolase
MSFPAPFDRFEGVVRPEWIDANGHMNLAYYVVLFDSATDAIFETLGIGWDYRHATGNGTFAVETHTLYERELLRGEVVRVRTLVLGHDAKRLHLAHEMRRAVDGARAAAQELMYLHIDLGARRVTPWPVALHEGLTAAAAAHRVLARPDWIGRRIAMPGGDRVM